MKTVSSLSFFVLFSYSLLCAQTSDSLYQLSPVDISADFEADALTPVSYWNLRSLELDPINVGQEPAFLLSQLPSVTVYSDAGSYQGYAYFRLRGIDQTRINLTLDGMPLNEPEDQGVYFNNYPDFFNSISQVQVQRGVGTSKNGSASFGGSLQFQSPDIQAPKYFQAGLNYGSFNTFRLFAESNSGLRKDQGLYLRASVLRSDGYKIRSGHLSQSFLANYGHLGEKDSWKLTVMGGHQQNEMAWLGVSDSLIRIEPRSNANSEEDDEFYQGLVQLQQTHQFNSRSSLKSSAFYNYLNGNYDFDLDNFLGLETQNEFYNYAFLSHFGGFFTHYRYETQRLQWTTGLHLHRYTRRHTGTFEQQDLYQNTGLRQEASAFTKLQYQWARLTLFADLQGRYTDFAYQGSVEMEPLHWTFLNPKIGLTWQTGERSQFYYSLGQTGREPTRNDLFGGSDDLLADSLGHALLFITQTESVLDQEWGFRYRSSNWQVQLNAFYMDFQNEITLNGQFGPNGLSLTNAVENSFRSGLEADLVWQAAPHWRVEHHSSWLYARIEDQGEIFQPILTPNLMLFQELSYQPESWSFALSARYQGPSYIDFANTVTLDPYWLLGARAGYSWKQFSVQLQLNNLLNVQYYNNGYVDYDGSAKYFIQAPRNGTLSIGIRMEE